MITKTIREKISISLEFHCPLKKSANLSIMPLCFISIQYLSLKHSQLPFLDFSLSIRTKLNYLAHARKMEDEKST